MSSDKVAYKLNNADLERKIKEVSHSYQTLQSKADAAITKADQTLELLRQKRKQREENRQNGPTRVIDSSSPVLSQNNSLTTITSSTNSTPSTSAVRTTPTSGYRPCGTK